MSKTAYQKHKERTRLNQAAKSAAGRDIAPLPNVVDPARKMRAMRSLRVFCEEYFPEAFPLHWSEDHLTVIKKIELAVRFGRLFAQAMPRGSGKTTLIEVACVWAALIGAIPFILIVCATADMGEIMLESIKTHLANNERLLEDFPEVCYPIRKLERINNRAAGQTYLGKPTEICWTGNMIILPSIAGSQASEVIIKATGMDSGNLRGQKHTRADGRIIRPSLVIMDDPQTRESAYSLTQCDQRERILMGDILGMAGPGKKIAGIICCTVIRRGDLADRLLDRKIHPVFQGVRTKALYEFPKRMDLWEKYWEIRKDSLVSEGDGREATHFYRENRAAMEDGAHVAWPARIDPGDLSALETVLNWYFTDKAAFFAERQNAPLEDHADEDYLTGPQIAAKLNGYARRIVPAECQWLTAMIDVHYNLLYWAVVAWSESFTGWILDYGTFPEQRTRHFSLASAAVTMPRLYPTETKEGAVVVGLGATIERISKIEYQREDGVPMHVAHGMIDSGFIPNEVRTAIRTSVHGSIWLPSLGQGVRAANKPFADYRRYPGDRTGNHWRIPGVRGQLMRHVDIDTNFWKSFMQSRFLTGLANAGSLSFYGRDPHEHRLIAEHLTAEYRVRTQGRGRTVDEWYIKPGSPDNHWLDVLVGCCVGASILGAKLPGVNPDPPRVRKKVRLSDLQKQKRQWK